MAIRKIPLPFDWDIDRTVSGVGQYLPGVGDFLAGQHIMSDPSMTSAEKRQAIGQQQAMQLLGMATPLGVVGKGIGKGAANAFSAFHGNLAKKLGIKIPPVTKNPSPAGTKPPGWFPWPSTDLDVPTERMYPQVKREFKKVFDDMTDWGRFESRLWQRQGQVEGWIAKIHNEYGFEALVEMLTEDLYPLAGRASRGFNWDDAIDFAQDIVDDILGAGY